MEQGYQQEDFGQGAYEPASYNLLGVDGLNETVDAAEQATESANEAASEARSAAQGANEAAESAMAEAEQAQTSGGYARRMGDWALSATDAATEATTAANSAASSANDAAQAAIDAASAQEANNLAQAKNNADQAHNNEIASVPHFVVLGDGEYDSDGKPTIDGMVNKTYFVPNSDSTPDDAYVEWAFVNGEWERMGSRDVTVNHIGTNDIDAVADDEEPTGTETLGLTGLSYLWTKMKSKFASKAHAHSAADVTSGILPLERGGTGRANAAGVLNMLFRDNRGSNQELEHQCIPTLGNMEMVITAGGTPPPDRIGSGSFLRLRDLANYIGVGDARFYRVSEYGATTSTAGNTLSYPCVALVVSTGELYDIDEGGWS